MELERREHVAFVVVCDNRVVLVLNVLPEMLCVLCWWRVGGVVVRPPVLPACFTYPCARLTGGRSRNNYSYWPCNHFVGEASAISQPTRPTQPVIPPGSVKLVVILANGQVAAQACVCSLWAVAWVAGGFGQ